MICEQPNRKANNISNVHERLFVKGQERKKQGEIERELIKQENESQLTFKPEITHYKRRGEGNPDDPENSPVFDRLTVKSNTKQIMQNVLAKLKDELELKDCTFKPQLVSSDPRRNSNVQEFDPSRDTFLGRMAAEKEKLNYDMKVLADKRRHEEMEDVTFAPAINPMSAAIVALKRGNKDCPSPPVHERLAHAHVRHSSEGALGGGSDHGGSRGGSQASSVYGSRGVYSEEPRKVTRLSEADRDKVSDRLAHKKTQSFDNFLHKTTENDTPLPEDQLPHVVVLDKHTAEQVANRLYAKQTVAYQQHHEEVDEAGMDVTAPVKIVPATEVQAISDRLYIKRTTSWQQKKALEDEPPRPPPVQRDDLGRIVVPAPNDKIVALSTPRSKSPKSDRTPQDAMVFNEEPRELVFPASPVSSSAPTSPHGSPTRRLSRSNSNTGLGDKDKPIGNAFDFSEMDQAVDAVSTTEEKLGAGAAAADAAETVEADVHDAHGKKKKKKKVKKSKGADSTAESETA